jgi:exopolysaccharide biosynthesis polyprenyl glycosylphosphotransferase
MPIHDTLSRTMGAPPRAALIGRKQELNLQFLQIADGILLAVAFWLAHTLRFVGASWFGIQKPIGPFADFQWLLFIILPFGPIFLDNQGFYVHPLQKTFRRSLTQIAHAGFWLGLVIAGFSYFLKLEVPSRAVMPLFALFGGAMLLVRERITLTRYRALARREDLRERVIMVGTPGDLKALRQSMTTEQITEMVVVEEFDIETEPIRALVEALHKHSVSRVIFAGGHSHLDRLQEAIAACEIEGVEAWLIADFIRTSIARPDFDVFGARPVLVFRTTPDLSVALAVKGAIDRLGALVLLALTSWLMVLVAVAIKATSPGPIIFRQKRAGKNGKPFTMYKFRSMQTNAEMLHSELAAFNQMSGPVFKLDKDPRITPVGHFIRRTSIDELPQLLNVLRGDMSLVGPRPLPIYEVEKFESPAQRRRLSMKPGLTCLWQVSGRNDVKSFDQWVRLDLEYIDNWSLFLDFKILLKTVPVVLFGTGAK